MSISDKELAELTKNITKALNALEKPLNAEQTRAIILQTHRIKEARVLWKVAGRQLLTINRFSAWKFCSLLHKVLRDGHSQAIRDSQQEKQRLNDIGCYWALQPNCAGLFIARYCAVLYKRLEMHELYECFDGNLQFVVDTKTLDLNMCFSLCTDVFDLLDYLLKLQENVFSDMATLGYSNASTQNNCRLEPLTTVAEDCNALYHSSVHVMRTLYAALSLEDVHGLGERFDMIFKELKIFFWRLQSVKCVMDIMLEIPQIPILAPNFYTQINAEDLPIPSAPSESDLDMVSYS